MNCNTQNKKIEAVTEKTLIIGIDVGSEMHYARAFDYRGIEYSKKPFSFNNSEAGFEMFKAWIYDIKEKHEEDKVVPEMEPTGHYWFNLGKNVPGRKESGVWCAASLLYNQKDSSIKEDAVADGSCSKTAQSLLCHADKRRRVRSGKNAGRYQATDSIHADCVRSKKETM